MNYGTDLKLKTNKMAKGFGGGMDVKGRDKPRPGAAKGQGEGMGGMNQARIAKAMMEVKGQHGGRPEFYCGGRRD